MKKERFIFLLVIITILFSFEACANTAKSANTVNKDKNYIDNETITDANGKNISKPASLKKIAVLHGNPEYIVWRLAPDRLVNNSVVFTQGTPNILFPQKFMPPFSIDKIQNLPMTGNYMTNVNTEEIIAAKPDIILTLSRDPGIDSEQERFGVPVIGISKNSLSDIEESIRFIGKLVGNEKEADDLADYWGKTVNKVTDITSKIPDDKKLKVYYTSSVALNTVGPKTIQASIIRSAGGINYYDANPIAKDSLEQTESVTTSIEDIIKWNPDVIITGSKKTTDEILSNSQWKDISAVINERVYTTLQYASMDHFVAPLNLMWTANKLYPDQVNLDINKEAKELYNKFYYTDQITDEDMAVEKP
ncbi:ABC transporter substrate-binding protein [Clostridium sp.]|uniref:ABC transporter substrate-binding protein n=1 Tax=Clostridium sp. TaxID=1506 RepID=UPI0026192A9B|nr:ABC transporter substrate-binding protein [Clostridium sp.]